MIVGAAAPRFKRAPSRYRGPMKQLVRYFLRGLVFVVPIAFTVWIFVVTFRTIDGWLGFPVPGVGILVLVAATVVCGVLVSNLLTRRFLAWLEAVLDRLPVVSLLHSSVKDLLAAFVGEKRRLGRPVLVDLDASGALRTVGFVTRESLPAAELADAVAVYLPQSYNFAGQLVIVPRARVHSLSGDGPGVMQFIVSGGVAGLEPGKG
jgi:uncharacterized membrane protein